MNQKVYRAHQQVMRAEQFLEHLEEYIKAIAIEDKSVEDMLRARNLREEFRNFLIDIQE